MLERLDGKLIEKVPYKDIFKSILDRLGTDRSKEIRYNLNRIIDELPTDKNTGYRKFNTTWLGSHLGNWSDHGIGAIYDVAREILGPTADNEETEARAALIFGQFIPECLISRNERWIQYDPNIAYNDPSKEIIGKSYFESR
jgi:hypothetical protein